MDATDERECRICRGDAEPERPLFFPCKCSGSIKYTHEDCLIKWLAESGSSQCELCHHSFRFEPLYEPDTPQLLPTREFIIGIVWRIRLAIKTAARIALVFVVWLFLLPLATCWTWYLLFVKSLVHLPVLVLRRGLPGLITDTFRGCLLSVGIVFVFLGVQSLREYVRHIPDEDLDHAQDGPLDEPIGEHLDLEEQIRLNGNDNNEIGTPLDVELNDFEEPEALEEWDELLRDTMAITHSDEEDEQRDDGNQFDVHQLAQGHVEEVIERLNDNNQLDEQGLAGLLEIVGDFADDFADEESGSESDGNVGSDVSSVDTFPDFEHDMANFDELIAEQNVNGQDEGGALFRLFDLVDPDDVPLEEVVGLRGPLWNLLVHAGTVLISNALFLGIFTFIPLCIGRFTLRMLSFRSFPIPASFGYETVNATAVEFSTVNGTGSVLDASSRISIYEFIPYIVMNVSWSANMSLVGNSMSLVRNVVSGVKESIREAHALSSGQSLVSYADNFLVVLLGYGVLSLCAITYVILNSLLRSRYPRFDSPMTRHVAGMLRYIATIVKIIVLILFEFGIFPLGCGWWLDVCTLNLVGATLQSRLAFCRSVPWLATAGHWLLGIVFMVQISLFVSLLREVLRPQLLWFLRNPDDPDFHPFRELVEKPLSRHARRMCLSVLIYVPLVVATVYVPVQICCHLLPEVFPLRFDDFSHSLTDVPFGNLLVVPLVSLVHHSRPGLILRKGLELWIDVVGSSLGILHLVARGVDDNDEIGNNVDENGVLAEDQVEAILRLPEEMENESDNDATSSDGVISMEEESNGEISDLRIRAAIMILFAWATLVVFEFISLSVPIVTGRNLMKLVGLPVHHDLHSFGTGCYVLLMSAQILAQMKLFLANVDATTLLRTALPRIRMVAKGGVLIIVWLGVIPLIAGVLLELTITVPLRVPHNETPYLYLQQDWALGLLIMKLWNKVALAGRLNLEWRERVERAREGGFLGMGPNLERTLQEVVLPVLGWTLVALSAPYAVAFGLLPLLGCSAFVTGIVYRFSYLSISVTYLLQLSIRTLFSAMRSLHDSIRDDRYLIGKRLYNFRDNAGAAS